LSNKWKENQIGRDEKMTTQDEMKAKAIDLAGLVQYQNGSVVSKQIIKKDIGTVTVFAFDKGEGLSEHTAPFDALVQILDGVAEISIAGNPHTVKSGEFIVMPANESHALKAVERFKMMLVMIRQ
jgi:quercetin dioxygenase-like cupin family protein